MAALMLDMKRTFDELVTRFAESEEARERILGNRIYQHVSDALAGSAEYSAMEKVFELSERDDFDLIVVDTPPSQHALDFLEAPRRLLEFLDSRLVQILLHPAFAAGRLGFRLFQRGTERVLRVIEKVSGVSFLEDISEFLLAFEGMSEGFRERARQVQARLLGPDAAFVLAASPAVASTKHALAMLERLVTAQVPLAGVIVNRVHLWPVDGPTPERVPAAGAERKRWRCSGRRSRRRASTREAPSAPRARRSRAPMATLRGCAQMRHPPPSWSDASRAWEASCGAFRSSPATCTISRGWRACRIGCSDPRRPRDARRSDEGARPGERRRRTAAAQRGGGARPGAPACSHRTRGRRRRPAIARRRGLARHDRRAGRRACSALRRAGLDRRRRGARTIRGGPAGRALGRYGRGRARRRDRALGDARTPRSRGARGAAGVPRRARDPVGVRVAASRSGSRGSARVAASRARSGRRVRVRRAARDARRRASSAFPSRADRSRAVR